MTVHLLANSGHGSFLQQTLDQLLDYICPEVRLFLVSERVSPVKYYERSHPKRSRFPGVSVLLFLHESFGEERLLRVLDSLQRSPWQCYPTQDAQGRLCPYLLANQEFYSLDSQMPVWGVRQVQGGAEILRVTLYCSFDNYEDAIRLYEMILQKEATLQKSNFCFFVLYATDSFTLQLSLKQLPLGMSVDPKESSVLQFKVQEIGQLVPLLPNPCIPISSTRWQTQDYDGNKILLQVQLNPEPDVQHSELPLANGVLGVDATPRSSRLTCDSARSQRSRGRRLGVQSVALSEAGGSPASDSSYGAPWKRPSHTSQASSPATGGRLHLPSPQLEHGARLKALSWEKGFQKLEAETNVDTGFTTINSESRHSFRSRVSREFQTNQSPSCLLASSLQKAPSSNGRVLKERVCASAFAGQKEPSARKIGSKCSLPHPVQGEEKEEEEFFI